MGLVTSIQLKGDTVSQFHEEINVIKFWLCFLQTHLNDSKALSVVWHFGCLVCFQAHNQCRLYILQSCTDLWYHEQKQQTSYILIQGITANMKPDMDPEYHGLFSWHIIPISFNLNSKQLITRLPKSFSCCFCTRSESDLWPLGASLRIPFCPPIVQILSVIYTYITQKHVRYRWVTIFLSFWIQCKLLT